MSSRSIAGAGVLAIVMSCLTATSSDAQAVILCAGHEATIVGTAGDDTLTGTDGPDVIVALEGDDHVDGFSGDDRVCGGDGHDFIGGQDGNDLIYGGFGNDAINGDPFMASGTGDNDRLFGGPGNDVMRSSTASDLIDGGTGIDDLWAGNDGHQDTLRGGYGDDRVIAAQPNIVYGGPGNDRVAYELVLEPGGLIDLGPGTDTTLGFVDHTGSPAVLNFRTGEFRVGSTYFDVVNDEMRSLPLGGGRFTVIGRDRAEHVSARQLVWFSGHGGNDVLDARGGNDTFLGGRGFDIGRMDGGTDTCRSVERRFGCDR